MSTDNDRICLPDCFPDTLTGASATQRQHLLSSVRRCVICLRRGAKTTFSTVTEMEQNGTPIPKLSATVEAGAADSFEAWRWALAPIFDVDVPPTDDLSNYRMHSTSYHFGDMLLGLRAGSGSAFRRNQAAIARGGLDSIVVSRYSGNAYRLSAHGRETQVEPGDVAILDLAQEVQIDDAASSNTAIILSRPLLEQLTGPIDHAHGTVLRRGSPHCDLISAHLEAIAAAAPQMPVQAASLVSSATASLVAAAVGMSTHGREPVAAGVGAVTLNLLRREIEKELGNPALEPELLMRRFAISRTRLYRLFQPLGGVSHYIRNRRLRRALGEIVQSSPAPPRVAEVAYRWGFRNAAVFSRIFREVYGMSPTEAREAFSKENHPFFLSTAVESGFDKINFWLRASDR